MESTRGSRAALRRAGLVLALIGLAIAPATLVPASGIALDESPWPFSMVPRAIVHGASPDGEQAAKVVPVRFRLGGFRGLEVLAERAPVSTPVDCHFRTPRVVASPASAPAKGVLTYDPLMDTYTFWWRRSEAWADTCRWLILKLDDGSIHSVLVTFGKNHTMLRP
ncbi:MAG: PxKF domain-containing protein [Actinomycetota bacterium]|nr:PxKF domain-containing protein [Actinomycetota bacterium]